MPAMETTVNPNTGEELEVLAALTVREVITELLKYPLDAQVCGLYDGRRPVTQVIGSFYGADDICPIVMVGWREGTAVPEFNELDPKFKIYEESLHA